MCSGDFYTGSFARHEQEADAVFRSATVPGAHRYEQGVGSMGIEHEQLGAVDNECAIAAFSAYADP